MTKTFTKALFIFINVVFINISIGQRQPNYAIYNQDDFEENKVFNEVYSFWNKDKQNWFSSSENSVQEAHFVDARNYKGLINYGVTFRSKTFKNFYFIENLSMCFLKVEINKCTYNPKDSIAEIAGFVSGNDDWGQNVLLKGKKTKNYVEIFFGEKKDTIRVCYLGKTANRDSVEVKLNNKEANEFTALDTFPSFYFKKYSYYKTILGNRQFFKISGKVNRNTFLAFGSSYSEIFDIGTMIYGPMKNKRNKTISRENFDCVPIITGNKFISDIEKEKAQEHEITYYTYTKKAEDYILSRQYGKSKEQYNLLSQNYPRLFARDIHNAIRCAILSRDLKTAFWWGEKLALKGINISYFDSKIFSGMRKNPEWKNFSTKYDSICKLTKGSWNLQLKKELNDLLAEDQADYGLENRKSAKILYETTERVTGKLIDLLKSQGYPSEEKIGSLVVKDTVIVTFPDFNVLILHAIQQTPKNLVVLNELLDKSSNDLEYDRKRSFNNTLGYGSCFRIYKGKLYNSKQCMGNNDLEVRKISFKFNNPNGFIMNYGNFVIEAHNSRNEKEVDDDYKENYNLIMKLTNDWEFYDK